MIDLLTLRDFKCFEFQRLPMAPLTLLTGANSTGKSSVLQALILLHQSMREHEWSTRLPLNGIGVKLGTVGDVVDVVNGRTSIEITLADGEHEIGWCLSGEKELRSMQIDRVTIDGSSFEAPVVLHYLLPTEPGAAAESMAKQLRRLTYVTAERVGPRDFYLLDYSEELPVVGTAGQHAIGVLHQYQDSEVRESLLVDGAPRTLIQQAQSRLARFFPGFEMSVREVEGLNAVALGTNFEDTGSGNRGFFRPSHVGFGLTQVLPIVVAALNAQEGDLLLIENPEVHLHPAGQAEMGRFLAEVAQSGVQVLLETHSDHVLNGVRRAVKDALLEPRKVAIHYFNPRTVNGDSSQVVDPRMDSQGNLDAWPAGFFDQADKDASFLAGWDD